MPTLLRKFKCTRVDLVPRGANFDDKTGDGAHILLYKSADYAAGGTRRTIAGSARAIALEDLENLIAIEKAASGCSTAQASERVINRPIGRTLYGIYTGKTGAADLGDSIGDDAAAERLRRILQRGGVRALEKECEADPALYEAYRRKVNATNDRGAVAKSEPDLQRLAKSHPELLMENADLYEAYRRASYAR
jgi:hypothetical protein